MAKQLSGYDISRRWFNFCFEHPEKITPNHSALLWFCIEHCNRLGWKEKFGLPTTMAKEAIGIRSYNTYIKTLNDLVEFGFVELIEKSKNQYSSNIIALSNNDKAQAKALDKAFIKHSIKQLLKQGESTGESIDSIDKPLTIKQGNNITIEPLTRQNEIFEWFEKILLDQILAESFCMMAGVDLKEFFPAAEYFFNKNKAIENWSSYNDFKKHFVNWSPNWQTLKIKYNGNKQSTFKDATGFRSDNPFLKEFIERKRFENMDSGNQT